MTAASEARRRRRRRRRRVGPRESNGGSNGKKFVDEISSLELRAQISSLDTFLLDSAQLDRLVELASESQ